MPRPSNKPVFIFLSYSTDDKKFVSCLKDELARLGAKVFLAHQDISPSMEWQETILTNLDTCDVFVPVLTDRFSESHWTDQESGIAFASRKFILPVAADQMPYGFIGRFQAVTGGRNDPQQLAIELLKGLTQRKGLRNRLRENVIPAFKKSRTYDEAGKIASILVMLSPFSRRQMDLLLKAANSNRQVYESGSAIECLGKILKSNFGHVSNQILARFEELSGFDWS